MAKGKAQPLPILSDGISLDSYREQFDKLEKDAGAGQFVVRRSFVATENRAISRDERSITSYISTVDKDRYGDIVEPGGMDASLFQKNPVVLWGHMSYLPPIARNAWLKADEKGILAKSIFDTREEAEEIFRLYEQGFLHAFSIGFLPKVWERMYTDDGGFQGIHFQEWEMLEYSGVSVPANGEALVNAYQKGLIKDTVTIQCLSGNCEVFKSFLDDEKMAEKVLSARDQLQELLKEVLTGCAGSLQGEHDDIKAELETIMERITQLEKQLEPIAKFFSDDAPEVEPPVETPAEDGDNGEAKLTNFDASDLIASLSRGGVSRLMGRSE
jgi:HK97 family phage prohead protease